jgi:trans-aconitate 2-methyltransferase
VLRKLRAVVADDGWLAFQVPGNFDEPSHRLLRDLARTPPYADATRGVEQPWAYDAHTYLADLASPGWRVDAWETTYLHVLQGPDAVFRWISGTGARPVLHALTDAQREAFVGEYKRLLHDAYPQRGFGTVLPFRRVFVVAHHGA